MNPMVDGWIGDDWFHRGAFRQFNVRWIYEQVATRKGDAKWWRSHHDEYDTFMQVGSAGERKSLSLLLLAAHGRVLAAAGRNPVYLLDDADAELSTPTLAAVWRVFDGVTQLFASSNRPQAWLTLPVGLQVVAGGYGLFYAQNMAAAVLGAAPLLIVFLIFQKRIVEGVAGVGLK